MLPLSVVIIAKNEALNIRDCIRSARQIASDIVVVDTGSTDLTVMLAKGANARVVKMVWYGYGHARNRGADAAAHDWIFSLDADERISPALVQQLKQFNFNDPETLLRMRRLIFFDNKPLRFGTPATEKQSRLYHRKYYHWDEAPVHENLIPYCRKKIVFTRACLEHYGIKNRIDHESKWREYAELAALKYYQAGVKTGPLKKYAASSFAFLKSYIFLLGWLDGKKGFSWARTFAIYTWLKYKNLEFLHNMEALQGFPVTATNRFSWR